MKKRLRMITAWIAVSLLLQFGGYAYFNNKIQQVMAPAKSTAPITKQLKATIPGTDLQNIQVSYAKDYVAYMENDTMKVFNLKTQKVVFSKASPSPGNSSLGVLTYQWLPDRNTLLYFYAKKNPNPYTYVTVYPKSSSTSSSASSSSNSNSSSSSTSTSSAKTSSSQSSAPGTTSSQGSSSQQLTEDPNQKPPDTTDKTNTTKKTTTTEKPYTVKQYNNPQITELYSLDLPDDPSDTTAPDDRYNRDIDNFPAGGKVEELVDSTLTNLLYLTVKSGSAETLLQIDVMQNINTLSKSGESIDNMAASDRFGTLYIDSEIGGTRKVVALDNNSKRFTISTDYNDHILGIKNGSIYVAEVQNGQLTAIKTADDVSPVVSNPSFKTVWQGSIPYDDSARTLIGAAGQVIVYDNQTAYIIKDGNLSKVALQGDENYVSFDGAELIQLTKSGDSTIAELQPLKS